MEVNLKVYCKNCKYFPRFNFFGKRLATCKLWKVFKNHKLKFYAPEYRVVPTFYESCSTQNSDNDCSEYEERK
jgi:hypothetical protein